MTKEEKNVFRDAKFGDKFFTRNGRIMIYQKQAREDVYCLFDEESDCVIEYCSNGDVIYEYTGNAEPQEDDIVKKYVQPSLPSSLDEAEFEYVQSLDEMPANQEEEEMIYNAFKAGAEWMAEQGISIPAHIFMPCEIKDVYDSSKGEYPAAIHPDCGGSLVLERYLKDFKHNEEVILQIRKKEE